MRAMKRIALVLALALASPAFANPLGYVPLVSKRKEALAPAVAYAMSPTQAPINTPKVGHISGPNMTQLTSVTIGGVAVTITSATTNVATLSIPGYPTPGVLPVVMTFSVGGPYTLPEGYTITTDNKFPVDLTPMYLFGPFDVPLEFTVDQQENMIFSLVNWEDNYYTSGLAPYTYKYVKVALDGTVIFTKTGLPNCTIPLIPQVANNYLHLISFAINADGQLMTACPVHYAGTVAPWIGKMFPRNLRYQMMTTNFDPIGPYVDGTVLPTLPTAGPPGFNGYGSHVRPGVGSSSTGDYGRTLVAGTQGPLYTSSVSYTWRFDTIAAYFNPNGTITETRSPSAGYLSVPWTFEGVSNPDFSQTAHVKGLTTAYFQGSIDTKADPTKTIPGDKSWKGLAEWTGFDDWMWVQNSMLARVQSPLTGKYYTLQSPKLGYLVGSQDLVVVDTTKYPGYSNAGPFTAPDRYNSLGYLPTAWMIDHQSQSITPFISSRGWFYLVTPIGIIRSLNPGY